MPFLYERDDARRLVVVTWTGAFQGADVLDLLRRQREDGTWTYGLLLDTVALIGHPTIEELRQFMKLESEPDGERQRGPLAFVATDPRLYVTACAYAMLGASARKIQVFRNRDEADLWLTTQTA